jgi:carboxyl-terminal processing protease
MNQYPKHFPWLKGVFFSGAIATTAALSLIAPTGGRSVFAALQDSPKNLVDEVWQIVNQEYVDNTFNQVNWQATRQQLLSKTYTSKEQAYTAIREALKPLGDPYTRFMDPEQFRALTSQTSGELTGVGIRLGLDEKTKALQIVTPIDNSPAAKANLQTGDGIVAIDGKSTKGMTLDQASSLIRGEVGTSVTLRIERTGTAPFNVKLKRAQIELPAIQSSIKQEGEYKIGYISLNEFSAHAPEQMEKAIKNFEKQGVNGYVLDLRGNPGGLLNASVEIARMWIDNGIIVSTVDRKGGDQKFSANHTALTKLPLVVLVDGSSASASEILTGALKDNKRAEVIGSKTFGKAVVQSVHSLSDGSGLAVTIQHYYLPNGEDINHKGIEPDVKVDLTQAQEKNLESNPTLRATNDDPQYKQAITTLTTNITAQSGISKPAKPLSIRN